MARSNKYSYNPIPNLDTDWEQDPTNGNKPFSGESVQGFIKGKLRQHDGKVSGVRVNNQAAVKDANGIVDVFVPTVDSSLNEESSNAIENGVVAQEINDLKTAKVGGMHTEEGLDGQSLNLILENEQGDEIASCLIPKSSEGGNQTYIRVTTSLSKNRIKQGDSIVLTWKYNHYNGDGTPTGKSAETITIRAVNGTTEVYREVLSNISDNTQRTLNLGPDVLTAGTVGIYVQAIVKEEDGSEQRGQGYKAVQVVTIDLTSTFDPAAQLSLTDGFTNGTQIDVPFTITGPKGSNVTMWLDGVQYDSQTINTSATTMGHFYISASELSAGKHNIQMVAESDGLLSNVVYCDFRKAGNNTPYIGLKLLLEAETMNDLPLGYDNGEPDEISVNVIQFGDLDVVYAAWNNSSVYSTILVNVDGLTVQTLTADRTQQSMSQRFDVSGPSVLTLTNGAATQSVNVEVSAAEGIDEQEANDYVLKLTATGRSNAESNPADWGGVTTFNNVDFKTSGWIKKDGVDCLALFNGATATIENRPFVMTNDYSVERSGMTVEMEVMISQVLERGARIVGCVDGNPALGFDITTEEAALHLGQMQNITTAEKDEHDQTIVITRELGVAMNIATDKWMKVAFVVQPTTGGRKVFLFINGVLSKANQYDAGLSMVQSNPKAITFDSDKADVYVRSVRIYHRALSHSEILANYIVDRPTAAEIMAKHNSNVVSTEGSALAVDPQTLIEKGRGVLIIVGEKNGKTILQDLYDTNDKKYDGTASYIHWYSPLGRAYDFEAYNVYVRIQGTSSVKYPWKNIRIYLNKGPFTQAQPCSIVMGGKTYEQQTVGSKVKLICAEDGSECKGYALRGKANSIEQTVLCAKTDFVDSSMVLNTGGAILYDNTMRSLGLLTPPQQYDIRVRQAIDGIPCDVFCGTSINGQLAYYGQYNLNNEKSKSGSIFGMEKVKDSGGNSITWDCPIALEALDNGSPMTLFQAAGSNWSAQDESAYNNQVQSINESQSLTDEEKAEQLELAKSLRPALMAQLEDEFDAGFEFNFPEDTFYSSTKIKDPSKESVASATQKAAIRRWMGWLHDCFAATAGVQAGTMSASEPDYGTKYGWTDASKAKWVCQKFKDEASQYFDMSHLLCYYLFTDYHASVDQRAKNILWRTWDGLKWYSTYYDGDTAHSIRNDAFMVYLYNVTRDTWDDERNKYAFEGHNSWLWCLVLANFEEELRQQATNLRAVMTLVEMLNTFNETIMGNWSERQYNESGMLKYVDTMERQNYVYTLTGNREAHRTAFLTDRSQLLDARYATSGFQADYVGLRVGRENADAADNLVVRSGDLYYFGWKLSNGSWRFGPTKAEMGDYVTLPITGKLSGANDPLAVCGASRITELDFTGMHGHLMGDLDLSRCTMMSKLLMAAGANNVFSGIIMSLGNISKLEYVDLTGQISIGTNQAGTALDLSKQTRLQTLLLGNTNLQIVTLPEGSPLSQLVLPATVTRLSLRYLPNLSSAGLTIQGTSNVRQFIFAECPRLNWQELLAECANVEYIRVEGISGKVNANFLEQYIGKNGYDAEGNPVTFPALVGRVTLTNVITSERLATLRSTFRYLDIIECQYSDYKEYDAETDSENITNLDNNTGYDFENAYVASGHIVNIRNKSVPVKGQFNKQTNKMTLTKISETSYRQFPDGTTFDSHDPLGEGYDCFMYIPHFWYKGINDYKNQEKHTLLSSLKNMPANTWTNKRQSVLSDIMFSDHKGLLMEDIAIGDTFSSEDHLAQLNSCATYRMDVEGMKQVRYVGMNSAVYGSVFVNAAGEVIQKDVLAIAGSESSPHDFGETILRNGQQEYVNAGYIFRNVPENAKWLYFTCIRELSDEDYPVFAVDSDDIEAIEPGWVEHKSELIGIYGASIDNIDGMVRSLSRKTTKRGTGTSTTNPDWQYDADGEPTALVLSTLNYTGQDFYNLCYLRGRGYHDVSYEQNKIIAILSRCWCGDRDDQAVYGQGISAGYETGQLDSLGKRDSQRTLHSMNKIWGLEAWVACNWEFMDYVGVNISNFEDWKKAHRPVSGTTNAKWHIYDPHTQTERVVQGLFSGSGYDIARLKHGRYCDIIPSSVNSDNSVYSTCYAAGFWYTHSPGRVVGRAYDNANPHGGCVYAYANYDSSRSHTYVGARLAFSGEFANESEIDPDAEEEA